MIVKESDQTFIGERQQLQGVYQILDTEPYIYQNRGQTRHARGPVHESSVLQMSPKSKRPGLIKFFPISDVNLKSVFQELSTKF